MPLAGELGYFLFFFKKNVAFHENYLSLHPLQLGGIAQLVEHLLCKQRVAGSNPTTSTSKSTARRQSGGFFVSARKGACSFPYRRKKSIRAKPGRSICLSAPAASGVGNGWPQGQANPTASQLILPPPRRAVSEMADRRSGKSDCLRKQKATLFRAALSEY